VLFVVWTGAAVACEACKNGRLPKPGQRVVEYDLHIAEQQLSPAGRNVTALSINGSIPGPVLRFREGDFARIRVHNHLRSESTSIHWHGLLLPNDQDGVPMVTTPLIGPGSTREFGFTLRHGGTYWYHSHTGLQEQQGVYGGIVVERSAGEAVKADREEVIVLSDWTDWQPEEVMRMLMRGTDYFGLMRRNSQSVLGAWKAGQLGNYFSREWDRMMPMDVSDVGYHAFLINGRREMQIGGKPGERVRLRVINASASSYYYLSSSAGPLSILAADGQQVEPVKVDRFLMAIAETYDLLITLPASGRYELRATAQDGSGHVSAFFGQGQLKAAEDPPRPNLYEMDQMLTLALEEQEDDPRASLRLERPGSPYRLLRSPRNTSYPAHQPRRKITLNLSGDMNRYIWGFGGKTIAQEPYIDIRRGEVIQLELVNDSMMHHPIHLHGHFFRVIMNHGARSPLKHTIDVPPMSRRTVEFLADDAGHWLMHCHILYHQMSGMARIFRYVDDPPPSPVSPTMDQLGEHGKDMSYMWGAALFQTQMLEGMLTWMNPRNDLMLQWEIGTMDHQDYEVDLLYQRYFNMNFQAYAGWRWTNDMETRDRALAGVNYRLPLMFWSSASLDSEGAVRISLAKRLQLSPRVALWGEVFYDSQTEWEWSTGAEYLLTRNVSLSATHHSQHGSGLGLLLRF
jgi:FtsP/CotA-like multicopper oxidase with cupredoxin domain